MVAPRSAGSIVDELGLRQAPRNILARSARSTGCRRSPLDATLEQAAKQQAGYMVGAKKMAHRTGWGKDFASRMRVNGVRGAAAENVAYGQSSAKEVLSGWMTSKATAATCSIPPSAISAWRPRRTGRGGSTGRSCSDAKAYAGYSTAMAARRLRPSISCQTECATSATIRMTPPIRLFRDGVS